MNRLFTKLIFVFALSAIQFSSKAQVLDQDYYTAVVSNSSASINTVFGDNGQSFTAGITGYLSSVKFDIRVQDLGNDCGPSQSVSLKVNIYQGNGFGGALLGTSSGLVITESAFTLQTFTMPAGIFITSGSQYTLEIERTNTTCSFFVPQNSVKSPGTYAGGTAYASGAPNATDFLFQTFVIPCNPPSIPTLSATSSTICNGSSTTLSIASGNLNSASNWQWYQTTCGTGAVGSGTSITVSPTTTTTYYARGEGGCVSPSTCASITINVENIPVTPGTISGSNPICDNTTNTYSITPIANATSYIWTLPGGWSGTSTTSSISATANASSGSIGVQASNFCGTSGTSTQLITVNTVPPTPGAITGSSIYCPLGTDTYTISPVATATSYNWTLPVGWTGTSTTTSINATNNDSNGSISVSASNICGTSAGSSSILVVLDNVDPVIPTIASESGECSIIPTTPTTTDNCSGLVNGTTLTSFPITAQGTTIVTWTFDDGNGNSVTANQTIILDDVTDPVTPTLPNLTDDCSLAPTAPTTTDVCAGTIIGTTTTTFPVTTQGTTVVTWTFDDGNGNFTTANQNFIIDDVTDPVTPTLSNLTDECSVTPVAPTTTDNCVGTVTGTTSTSFPITAQGTTVVTWTFSDVSGNSTTANQNVIITDVTAPSISGCPSDITINVNNNGCSAIVNWVDPTATDNCAGTVTVTSNFNSGDVFLPGVTTVNYTFDDGNGNTSSCSFDVIVINDFGVTSAASTDVSCNGGTDGSIDITVSGGTLPYTFDWNSGDYTVEDPTGIPAGVYNGLVLDANGCADAGSITIDEPTLIDISIDAFTNPLICGVNNGTANITVTGGTESGTYDFLWDDGVSYTSTLEDPTNLPSGGISITATDDNGCMATNFLALTDPNGPTIVYNVALSDTVLNCNGDSDANININVTLNGGATSVLFDWNLGTFTSEDITGLAAGVYSVTANDNNGCSSGAVFSFGEPTAISISNSVTDVDCNGSNSGSIDLTVTGGTEGAAYDYDWNSGVFTSEDLNSIPAGTYDVTVTDDNGCVATDNFTVNEPTSIVITLDLITDANCNGSSDGAVEISVAGGTEVVGYDFDWNSGAFTTEDINSIPAGTYTVEATDDNGCTVSETYTVDEPTLIVINGVVTDASCNGESDGAINITVTGGTEAGTYDYLWDNAATTEDITGLSAGPFMVEATDDNGCMVSNTFTVNEPAAVDVSTTTSSVTITAQNAGATYQWIVCPANTIASGMSTGQSYTATANGDYAVIVTDGGCADTSACVTISTVGIDPINAEENISIYPNPTTGIFTIELNNNATIEITDAIGKVILTKTFVNGQQFIDLTSELNGIYFVKIATDNKQIIKKIVLNK